MVRKPTRNTFAITSPRPHTGRGRPRFGSAQAFGFTLIELLLVLALVVVIGALATPSLHKAFENQKLRYVGDLLRSEWSKTRNAAMKSGRIHMFRYQAGTGAYRVEAWVAENDELEAAANATETAAANMPAPTSLEDAGLSGQRELPGEAQFVDSQLWNDSRAAAVEEELPTATGDSSTWSRPILFYPDGTSSSARVVVGNERYFLMLSLRGLTGSTLVSDLLTFEEVALAAQN